MPSVNACVPHSIRAQVRQACDILQQHLATTLVGIYLFGSAVDGGLKPLSDVDLLVTVASPPSAATRHALMAALLRVSAPPRDEVPPLQGWPGQRFPWPPTCRLRQYWNGSSWHSMSSSSLK